MPILEFGEILLVEGRSSEEVITQQLIDLVPTSWTSSEAKIRGGVFWTLMSAAAQVLGFLKETISQARLELRLKTATGTNLDLIGQDYFSTNPNLTLPRNINESDNDYRGRLEAEILRIRGTVQGVRDAVAMLTGATPSVFEPFNVNSTGAWIDLFNSQYAFIPACWGSFTLNQFGTGAADPQVGFGGWGDLNNPYNFYITVINNPNGASESQIKAIVARVKPVGTIEHIVVRTS